MARLLEVYNDMLKEAEFAEVAEQVQTMFAKYAETAETLLKEEYGTDFNVNDVESLTRGLMERDSQILEDSQKVAEYEEIGKALAYKVADEIKTAAIAGNVTKGADAVRKTLRTTASIMKHFPAQSAVLAGGGLAAGAAAGRMFSGGDN
jgi:type IV secretory pathway VirJ component